jgi:HEAT repeat protein
LLSLLSLSLPAFAGCANFWDDITSRDFSFKAWYSPPDPLTVLQDSKDGDKRALALRSLKEPKQTGGSDKDQNLVVDVLTTAVKSERAALCRVAAIEALEKFQDPRAVDALQEAYYRASFYAREPASMNVIRCRAIAALGETHKPEAVPFLVRIVNQPPVAKDAPETEKQQRDDERVAAARALGNFTGRQPAEALVIALKSEPDVALRSCAYRSLKNATGQTFTDDPKLWSDYLANAGRNLPEVGVYEKTTNDKFNDALQQVGWHNE